MNQKLLLSILCSAAFSLSASALRAQTSPPPPPAQTKLVLFDGMLIGGYADHGAFMNCVGPGVKFSKKPFVLIAGMLPSLRIKEDPAPDTSPQNSVVTPTLGFGLTAAYKHLAFQVPFYYNAKTAVADGKWNPGIGLGYKF